MESIFLGDKYLTDNPNKRSKWKMPNIWINSHEYLLFWADKDEEQGIKHCNFKLSASGEYIGIFNSKASEYELIEEYFFDEQQTDISIGRLPNGTGGFVEMAPTPGYENALVSTFEEFNESDIKIIPNPANSIITISLPKMNITEFNIKILDVSGKIVKALDILENNDFSIDISELHNGIYFVNIIYSKQHLALKLVIL
jgi:hypothetical protein